MIRIPILPDTIDTYDIPENTFMDFHCCVCGLPSRAQRTYDKELREGLNCEKCTAFVRYRSIAKILLYQNGVGAPGLTQMKVNGDFLHLQAGGALHDHMKDIPGYHCSEYLRDDLKSGEVVDGIRHEDVMNLSFPDESLSLVISSDVFEHVADPYKGHREIHRVLKPGGKHIFTVAFDQTSYLDEIRTTPDGTRLLPDIFHGDPIHGGALVYTIPGIEMLVRLAEIGLYTLVHVVHSPMLGIIGRNNIVFESVKKEGKC